MTSNSDLTENYSSYKKFLINQTILFAFKECLKKRVRSSEIKQKVLTLLYFQNNFNYDVLGINSVLLKVEPDKLSENEKEELKQYVFKEIDVLYDKISGFEKSALESEVDTLASESEVQKQINEVDKMLEMGQNEVNSRLKSYTALEDVGNSFTKRLHNLDNTTRNLFENILNKSSEEREKALQEAEKFLEDKIRQTEQEIEDIKIQLELMN